LLANAFAGLALFYPTGEEKQVKIPMSYPSLRVLTKLSGGVLLCAGYAASVAGQGLISTPGNTEVQQPTAEAIQSVCVQLNGLQSPGAPVIANPGTGSPQARLSNSCTLMVSTAFFNQGTPPPFDPTGKFNLRISDAELRKATQDIAPVQMNAQKQTNVEASKMNLVGVRLLDLRAGARGFTVSENGITAPATVKTASANNEGLAGATGGGASADDLQGRLGGFVNVAGNWGDVNTTTLQDGYRYRNFSLLAGVDYRVNDNFVLGGAFSYGDTHSSFDQDLGKVDAKTWGFVGYGSYYVDTWYVDGFVGYGSVDYDTVRNIVVPNNNPGINPGQNAAYPINTSATASPKGHQWSASAAIGRAYDFAPYTLTPSARLSYIWVKNDAFSEDEPLNGLGLAVNERTVKSFQSALGGKISTVVNTSQGVFTPYFQAQWVHEFENNNPSILSKYVNDPFNVFFVIPTAQPTRDYATLSLGASAQFQNNLSGFLQFSTALGISDVTNYGLVVGLRKQF
jgi:outer membrane autotransporter protein